MRRHRRTCKKKKARSKHDLASLGKAAHDKQPAAVNYFLAVGGGGASLVCAQAPSPKALAITTAIMITFKNFNLYRLLSQQVAPVCLDREHPGGNAFLNFFERVTTGHQIYFEYPVVPAPVVTVSLC
jgi:hypothetical protein